MKKILAIGSSQLAGFRKGFSYFDEQLAKAFDFAALWETGFGYLKLEPDGCIHAPDLVPKRNNPKKRNLKRAWGISGSGKVPCIHDYEKIFILASPCKYFAPFYYSRNSLPSLLSPSVLHSCFYSWKMGKQFNTISPWHFRVSPIVRDLIDNCPEKVIFIGAPLPLENLEKGYFEVFRKVLNNDGVLKDIHFQNIESIRCLCSRFHMGSDSSYDVFLPPDKLLCDLKLTTRSTYATKDSVWHAGSEYWHEIVVRIVERYLA